MSIITDTKTLRELELAQRQPNLSFLPFSVLELLTKIRSDLFPDVHHKVQLHFINKGPLACIEYNGESASIYIHQVLNHPDTPFELINLILKHELLHLRIPSALVDGKMVQHPPAFWAAERAIAPERRPAWDWIWWNLEACLKRRKKLERIDVRPNWRNVWNRPKTDISHFPYEANLRPKHAEESGGW